MALSQGEAQAAARSLRDVAADVDHAASLLPWYADGKVSGVQMLGIIDAAQQTLTTIRDQIIADIGD